MRPVSVAGGRRTVVAVRLSASEVARLDALRKGMSRSTYLRLLLQGTHHETRES